jgi:uncharacterized protein (DUF58 family)
VNLAASLAWHFSSQNAEVSFAVPGAHRTADLHEFLTTLALIEPLKDHQTLPAPQATMLREIDRGTAGEYNIILTAQSRGSLPTALWNCSYVVFVGRLEPPG